MKIAIIPARGGSKRIPRKNIRNFGGKPMIAWPISAALDSGLFDRIIVSTDDAEIADVARAAGAEVPFMRPDDIADDFSPTRAVINHAIGAIESDSGTSVTQACCIYATAAFVQADDLVNAHARLSDHDTTRFVFAAASFPHPAQRAMVETGAGGVEMLFPEHAKTRSQDLAETFHDAGMFYWGHRDAFMAEHPMFGPYSIPHLMPRTRTQDIDTPEDWAFAEALFKLI
ncbi:pseudaminic acid cytidylyltransferase [Phaeobacter gallaeciensis]|uniref:Pseudaminic acid cytidylyltransferase n=2 Tax=Roseobacteraceae TaxID=2854170 RepID=A0A366X3K4_9RHOB|nr:MULTISPECIES: pseudaminic acid cytidylyltransferase [Roseobacteraceae]MBT3140010.1 pseudaminic acid cytidylyltransferase [Falsiruegeria litorea]MBT8167157.1 pseudaminic acid cytidylyltransferase [Falsiruegeria litorea]RBW57046.1 pseudaminic acid cytidylyltransferase [Phaeobacter gallaeciensis]